MTPQPGSFSGCVSPETPRPVPRGRVPYLVPDGCISLCCSRCPACTARHLAAVWRKKPPLSIPPCSFNPSVPPASPGRIFLQGYTAQGLVHTLLPNQGCPDKAGKKGQFIHSGQMLSFKPQVCSARSSQRGENLNGCCLFFSRIKIFT